METRRPGYALARLASGMLITAALLSFGLSIFIISSTWGQDFMEVLKTMLSSTPLPLFLYLIWTLSIFGIGAAIVAITLYGYHSRWFWRCLSIASLLWLFLPPFHTMLGIIFIVLLLRFQGAFLDDTLNGEESAAARS